MTNQPALTTSQIRDLQKFMSMPDEIRTKAVTFAAGMLAAGTLAGSKDKTAKSENA